MRVSDKHQCIRLFGKEWTTAEIPILLAIILLPAMLFFREVNPQLWSIEAIRIPVVAAQLIIIGGCLLSIPPQQLTLTRTTFLLLATWLLWMLLSCVLSDHPWQSAMRLTEIIANLLYAGLLGVYLAGQSAIWRQRLFLSLLSIPLLCLLTYLAYWYMLDDPQNYDWVSSPPLFINIRHFGAVLTLSFPIGLWLLTLDGKQSKVAGFISLTILSALLFWTGGRGPVLAVSLISALFLILNPKALWPLLSALVTGLILSQWFTVNHDSMSLFRLFNLDAGDKTLDELSSSRLTIYTQSLLYWWNNAPITGLGPDAYRYITPPIADANIHHPHNVTIELLISFGIPGLLLSGLLLTGFISTLLKRLSSRPVTAPKTQATSVHHQSITVVAALSALAGLIHANLSGVLYIPYSSWLFATIMAICVAATVDHNNTAQTNSIRIRMPVLSLLVLACVITSIAFLQFKGSQINQPNDRWIAFNMRYPVYFDLQYWLTDSQQNGNLSREHWLLKAGATLSDRQQEYRQQLMKIGSDTGNNQSTTDNICHKLTQ